MLTGTVTSCIFKGVHYEMMVQTREGYEFMVQDYHCFRGRYAKSVCWSSLSISM